MKNQLTTSGPATTTLRRKVLICVTGLSPQIVTETLYALCVHRTPAWVPDEIRLITTLRGSDNARLMLLSESPGWFHRLRNDWGLPTIKFDASHIHVIRDAQGKPLDDIRDDADNQRAADGIADLVRCLTEDPATEIHASIAGGRKTMGFFMGYAMSLWGRRQDRLSHVLVSSPFESRPEFYYPTPRPHVIAATAPGQNPLDANTAKVWLGDIPFVRLRGLLPPSVTKHSVGFAQAVAAANRTLHEIDLSIDLTGGAVLINNGTPINLPPMQLALFTLLAWRCMNQQAPLRAPLKGATDNDIEWKQEVLHDLRQAMGEMNIPETLYTRLNGGASIAETFEQQLSKLQKTLRDSGEIPLHELLSRERLPGKGRQRGYQLNLEPSRIRFTSVSRVGQAPSKTVLPPQAG